MKSADIVVVGAGFSGLVAARELQRKGLSVLVLEAADRVGGRAMTVYSAAGTAVDLGGQWIGHDHSRMRALARECGIPLFPTHPKGRMLVQEEGHSFSPFSLTGLVAVAALARLALMASTGLGMRDDRTLADWLAGIGSRRARRVVEIALSTVTATDLDQVSLRALGDVIKASGGLVEMLGFKGYAQDALLTSGAGGLAEALAAGLRPAIMLNRPVLEIQHDDSGVTVRTPQETIRARRVIMAVAPPVARAIAHQPALPEPRARLQRDTFMGTIYKAVIVYDSPFWREQGLSGELLCLDGLVASAVDISPPGGPGHLCVLLPGRAAHALDGLDAEARRDAVCNALATHFGESARSPLSFHDKAWHQDEFVLGGYVAWPRPGSFDAVAAAGSAPVGRMHWAGTESASRFKGYLEGAVRAGERAAAEVLAAD